MFESVLKKFRDRIRALQFVVTLHAVKELEEEGLSVLDESSRERLLDVRRTQIPENGSIS
jgi:hypothetical protein